MQLLEFYQDLMTKITNESFDQENKTKAFFEYAIGYIIDTGLLRHPEYFHYISPSGLQEVHAIDLDLPDDENAFSQSQLTLLICDYCTSDEIEVINKVGIDRNFNKLRRLFNEAILKKYYTNLIGVSDDGYHITYKIYQNKTQFNNN